MLVINDWLWCLKVVFLEVNGQRINVFSLEDRMGFCC
jgi:hypothetical protein